MNAATIAANVASIERVPAAVWEAMAHGPQTRAFALLWARRGYNCWAVPVPTRVPNSWRLWLNDQWVELGHRAATAEGSGSGSGSGSGGDGHGAG